MTLEIFTVYDAVVESYLPPFHTPNIGVAIREFTRLVNSEGHQFNMYPEDYALYHVGSFDQESGKFETHEPTALGLGTKYINREETDG